MSSNNNTTTTNPTDLSATMAQLTVSDSQVKASSFWGEPMVPSLSTGHPEGKTVEITHYNPKGLASIKFCLDHKEEILALHSSIVETKVFELQCDLCCHYFKHCMFSKTERKGDHGYTACRWCQLSKGQGIEWDQFCIHTHIHCNRGGKKECGLGNMTLTRPQTPAKVLVREMGLADLAQEPDVVIKVVDKKMGQKARKAAEKEKRALAGL